MGKRRNDALTPSFVRCLLFAGARGFQLFKEIVSFVVDQDKCRKIFDFDSPDRFYAEFGIFEAFDLLDAFEREHSCQSANTAKQEVKASCFVSEGHAVN